MWAMILAAGFGTRLWPLTIDRTKPAVPILNQPLIIYSVKYLQNFGIQNLVVNLHHKKDSIRNVLENSNQFNCSIHYSDEEEQILGTSGAVYHAREFLNSGTFIVLNGKIITNIDLHSALETHRSNNALATLILRPNIKRERFSFVEVDQRNWITRFAGFPTAEHPVQPLMFTGIQILEPEIFNFIPPNQFSHSTTDVYPKAIAAGYPVVAHVADNPQEYWYEFSTLERYLNLNLHLLSQKESKNIIADADTYIDPTARVANSVMWKRVSIGPKALVINSILCDDVVIPAESKIENSVVINASKFSIDEFRNRAGIFIGENYIMKLSL